MTRDGRARELEGRVREIAVVDWENYIAKADAMGYKLHGHLPFSGSNYVHIVHSRRRMAILLA